MSWPKEVPVLKGSDFIRDAFNSIDNKKHCMMGWINAVFGIYPNSEREKVIDEICREAKCGSIVSFNDDRKTPKRTLASVWNRVMKKLGYTESC